MAKGKLIHLPVLLLSFLVPSILLLPAGPLAAQIKHGEKLLETGDYKAAWRAFRSEARDEKAPVEALTGLGRVYAAPGFSGYSLDSAYHYLQEAQAAWRNSSKSQKSRLDKNGYSSQDIARYRNEVVDSIYQQLLRGQPTLEEMEAFLTTYDRLRQRTRDEAVQLRDQLAVARAREDTTFTGLRQLRDNYGASIRRTDPAAADELEVNLLRAFVGGSGWEQLPQFNKLFPDHPAARDQGAKAFLASRGARGYLAFAARYPKSFFAPIARDSAQAVLARVPERGGRLEDCTYFLQQNTDHSQAAAVDGFISEYYRAASAGSPLEDQLDGLDAAILPQTLETVYANYAATDDPDLLRAFRSRYPGFHGMDRLEKDLAAAVEKEKTSSVAEAAKRLEAYLRENPADYRAFLRLQKLMAPMLRRKTWPEALALARSLEPHFKGKLYYDNLLVLLAAEEADLNIRPLGGGKVNSAQREYTPLLSADGNFLYFCRNSEGGLKREDIYVAQRKGDDWSEPVKIPDFDMSLENYAPMDMSVDGTRMLIFKGGAVAFSDKQPGGGWSELELYPETVNSGSWQGVATLAGNGRVLICEAAFRDDMIGGDEAGENMDLYVSFRTSDDGWSPGVNLGRDINTAYRERTPYLHPDMRTLYFSSEGHGGIGGLDVFKTTRLDDSWTRWSPPVHLGKLINSTTDDWGYKISTDGQTAYFAANLPGTENSDIFIADLPRALRPEPVVVLTGRIRLPAADTGRSVEALIVITDLRKGDIVAELKTDPTTGNYFVVVPVGRKLSYHVRKEGYFPVASHLDLTKATAGDTIVRDWTLTRTEDLAEAGRAIQLQNIFFEVDEYSLRPESFSELNRLAEIIKKHNYTAEIIGHTDNTGDGAHNQALSENRARSVTEYLAGQGVPAGRLRPTGRADREPLASNDTAEGRALNRRVEVKFEKRE